MVTPSSNGASIPATLSQAIAIAREAGVVIMRHYQNRSHLSGVERAKSDGSPVTAADLAAHATIAYRLKEWDESIPILSEEGNQPEHEVRRSWQRFWLVDPLDGTKEFINRNGEFTVNIAMIDGGVPVLGVVHAPALDETYAAAASHGSWRSKGGSEPERIFSEPGSLGMPLRVVESRSHGSPELEAFLANVNVGERIKVGSSLKFCRLAEGAADLYPRLGPTMEWDVAAGDCVYRNSARDGQHASPLTYNKPVLTNESFVIGWPAASGAVGALRVDAR